MERKEIRLELGAGVKTVKRVEIEKRVVEEIRREDVGQAAIGQMKAEEQVETAAQVEAVVQVAVNVRVADAEPQAQAVLIEQEEMKQLLDRLVLIGKEIHNKELINNKINFQ